MMWSRKVINMNSLDKEYFSIPLDLDDTSYAVQVSSDFVQDQPKPKVKPVKHHLVKAKTVQPKKKFFYAVARGRKSGIFKTWKEAQKQVKGYSFARYKKFSNEKEAQTFIQQYQKQQNGAFAGKHLKQPGYSLTKTQRQLATIKGIKLKDPSDVTIYTDGGMRRSKDLGAYAFIIDDNGTIKTAKRAVKNVTNQQMELMAVLSFLQHGKDYQHWHIKIVTDSKYLYNMFTQHWVVNWIGNHWKTTGGKPVANQNIIQPIVKELKSYDWVDFTWVKGHAKNAGNNRVDLLVNQAMDEYLGVN